MADFTIWDGVFPDFASAAGNAAVTGDGGGGFEGRQWIEKSVARARALETAFREHGSIKPAALTRDYVLPTVAALAHPGNRALRIVDFGGGLAVSFFPVAASLPDGAELSYHCVDNTEICAQGTKIFGTYRQLHFHDSLDEVDAPADIVHAGSALHYIDDWRGMLARFAAFRPRYLVLSDIPAGDIDTFVSVQTYYERRMRHWFWNFDEFVAGVKPLGFELVLRAKFQGIYLGKEGPYPMDNFPPERRLGYSCQLVFRASGR